MITQSIQAWTRKRAAVVAVALLCAGGLAKQGYGAGMLVADGGLGGVLEIQEHQVQVTLNNGIAVTHVTQVFKNTENRVVEALYTFPVPKAASVANFSMWIEGKEMVGEVLEKERAREIYNSYKRQKRDPGLLEQSDYRTFEMRIFPIPARAEQKVQITYYQEVDYDHDWVTYVYPLASVARPGVDPRVTGTFSFSMDVKSEIPISELSSPSHPDDFVMAGHSEYYQQASLETSGADLSRDLVVTHHLVRPKTGVDLLFSRRDGEDGYFCLLFSVGEELQAMKRSMDYVFVLDISGSMANEGKMDISRRILKAFIEGLEPEDRFEVIAFNVQLQSLFGELHAASESEKSASLDFIGQFRPRGGTILQDAILQSYRYSSPERLLNVVVLSDGMTQKTDRATLTEVIPMRPEGARVFCIGVGNDVNPAVLEQLAEESGGLAAFISREDDFGRQAQSFRRKLLRPVASDVEITFEGESVYGTEPGRLPNLYHGAPLRMYGRYRKPGPITVELSARIQDKPFRTQFQIAFPDEDAGNPEIERMWAWHSIQTLQAQLESMPGNPDTVSRIVSLGETYSIASEYTSFLVLENDAEYKRWKIERRNLQRMGRDREAERRLRAGLDEIRTRARNEIGPAQAHAQTPSPVVPDMANASSGDGRSQRIPVQSSQQGRGQDVHLPVGGGALDPVSALIALGLGGAYALHRKRNQQG